MNNSSPDPVRASIALRARYAGSFVGVLAACALIFLPPLVAQSLGIHLATAWGMGRQVAAIVCLLGAIPGFLFAPRFVHLGKSFELIG